VQRERVQQHVVIEANALVMRRLLASELFRNRTGASVLPLLGFWEETVPVLRDAIFDGILLDPFPVGEYMPYGPEYQRPFMHHAHRMLKPGGVFTYMAGVDPDPMVIEKTVNDDRAAAVEGGFHEEDIRIDVDMHEMVDHCETWPKCDKLLLPLLAPRIVKQHATS